MTILAEPVADTTTDPRWQPVRVTAHTGEPIVGLSTNALHLDGPLAYAAWLDHVTEYGHDSLPPLAEAATDFMLPLATWTTQHPTRDGDTVWGWACSRAHYQDPAHTVVDIRRRPETEVMARLGHDAKHHLSAGPLKARDRPIEAVITLELHWWALADPDPLRTLLTRVHAVGRHTRHGNGRVLSWTVAIDPDARLRWRDRTWPAAGGQPDSIRAPYHHPSRRMPCSQQAPAC